MTTSVDTKRAAERRDRAFLAATLVAWGALMLADRVWPDVGIDKVTLLALGLFVYLWGCVGRTLGPLVTGSLMTGIGVGVALAANAPDSRSAMTQGGLFVLSFAGGWALLALTSAVIAVPEQRWAWIPTAGLAAIGTALLIGSTGQVFLDIVAWAVPLALIVGGLGYLLWRRRAT
ncbi:MAG TPA: hypothetical protein VFR46_05370 [Actinomycetes bacterium]|nr:hypothetical protein [Actinomycetes bacterium]